MEKNHRLYLSNLPQNITKNEIEEQFQEYGAIVNVEVKQKDFHGTLSKFAFINIVTSERKLNACFRHINSLVLNGCNIHVEIAKENYLERLKREREEAAAKETNILNSKTNSTDGNDSKTIVSLHKRFSIPEPLPAENRIVIKEHYESHPKRKNRVESSQKISNIELDAFKRKTHRNHMEDEDSISDIREETSNMQSMHRQIYENPQISESEKKRLNSLRERKMAFKAKERVLRNALNTVDIRNKKNKIVFADNIDEPESCNTQNGKQKPLFEDEEDEEDKDEDESFWDKNDLGSSKKTNDKLKALQSRFGNDERFKLDNRFIEDEETADKADDEEIEPSVHETKWQMDILQKVLGKPIRIRESVDTGMKRKGAMVRYDPSINKHHEYEVTIEKQPTKIKKVKRTAEVNDPENDTPIPVSSETYYTVSDSFVNSLKGEQEFSLLKTFGNEPSNAKDAANEEPRHEKTFQFNFGTNNPFKYDSSNNGDDEGDVEAHIEEDKVESTTLSWHDNLFFSIDDPRFQGAEQFFSKERTPNGEFTSLRRELKEIVRSKIRNNMKKSSSWNKRRVKKRI